jgi:hypothetical protein
MQSKLLELLWPALTDIAPTVTVSGGMNNEARGAGGSRVEETECRCGARGRRSDVSSYMALQDRKFQAPVLITEILGGGGGDTVS